MNTFLQSALDYLWLGIMSASTTFIPWMLPLTYAAIVPVQMTNNNPHIILFVTVVGAILWTMFMRFGYSFFWEKISKYVKLWKEWKNEEKVDKKMSTKKSWLKRKTHELHQKMHMFNKPHILFATVFITTLLPIPDLVVIMHVQKKMNTLLFFVATVLGKILNYIPIIYGVEVWKMFF